MLFFSTVWGSCNTFTVHAAETVRSVYKYCWLAGVAYFVIVDFLYQRESVCIEIETADLNV